MAGCMSFFSGFSSSTGMLPRKMVHYSPKTYILPTQKLVFTGIQATPQMTCYSPPKLTLFPRKNLYYSPEPLYLLVFRLSPNAPLFSPKVYYPPKWCVITAQKLVLLARTLVFTGVQTIPQNGVLFPKKLVL